MIQYPPSGTSLLQMAFGPSSHRFTQIVEMFIKKMPTVFKDHELRIGVFRELIDEFSHIFDRTEFVLVAVDEKYRLSRVRQKPVIAVFIYRRSDADEPNHTVLRHPRFHPDA